MSLRLAIGSMPWQDRRVPIDPLSVIGGGVLTGLVAAGWRLADVPARSRANDAAATSLTLGYAHWVSDRHLQLGSESTALREGLGPPPPPPQQQGTGLFPPTPEEALEVSGYADWHKRAHAADVQIAQLRTEALRQYRDERRRLEAEVYKTYSQEDWLHRVYRRVRRQPAKTVLLSSDLATAVDSWRKPSHLDTDSSPVAVEDPSLRTDSDVRLTVRGTGP